MDTWIYLTIGGILFLLVAHFFASGGRKRGPSCGYLVFAALCVVALLFLFSQL